MLSRGPPIARAARDLYVRHHELSACLNHGAISEAASSGNFHSVRDDTTVEHRTGPYTHIIPDDALDDASRAVDCRSSPNLKHFAFSCADRQARVEIIRRSANVPEIGIA